MNKLALFNHGKDSEPWGSKILALAKIAEKYAYHIESLDYRQTLNPDERVEQLLAMDLSAYDEVVLIGSSMGGYVATVASEVIKPKGLFLMAPAFYLPDYAQTEFQPPKNTFVVHGWQDDVVPAESAWKFSQKHHCELKMLDADHRLMTVLEQVCDEFERFLARL